MTQRQILIGIMLVAVLMASAAIFGNSRTHAQDQGVDQASISAKLDQILNNEKVLMDEIASMRQELNVIKIRVTQAQ